MKGRHAFTIATLLSAAAAVPITTAAAPAPPANPCSVASTSRVGAWVCIDPVTSRANMEKWARTLESAQPKASTQSVTTAEVAPGTIQRAIPNEVEPMGGDGKAGWCSTVGCWYLYAGDKAPAGVYHAAEYDGTGFYGYGSTTIGSINFHIYDYLPDGRLVKLTNQHATASAARPYNVWWAGNLLVDNNHKEGSNCGQPTQSASVAKAANQTAAYDGAYLEQCIYSTQATKHTFFWRDHNYPGRWYHYAKLAKFTHELGYQSHYLGDWDTLQAPLDNGGSGWQDV